MNIRRCLYCDAELKKHQKKYCSQKCSNSCPLRKEKFRKSYPVDSANSKRKKTMQNMYGVDNYFQRSDLMKEHYIASLGVSNPAKMESHRERMRILQKTNNTSHNNWSEETEKLIKSIDFKDWLKSKLESGNSYDTIATELNLDSISAVQYYVKLLDLNKFIVNYKPYSDGEKELVKYVSSLNVNFETNKRGLLKDSKQELDVVINDSIAIEYNGAYWHSELYKEKYYHRNKTAAFDGRLLHIFDYEWKTKNAIVKDIINRTICPNKINKIYARKCSIRNISTDIYNDFCEKNHIQSYRNAKIKLGLYYNDVLYLIVSFTERSGMWELVRYAQKINYNVVGGFSRILNYFLKNHCGESELYTYCDIRLFTGSTYEKNGFKFSHITDPNYFYVDRNGKYIGHRYKFRKGNLNTALSEHEYMLKNKCYRVYDCGNKKFIYQRDINE